MPINCNEKITLSNLCVAVASQQQKSFRTIQQRYGDGYTARRQDGINPVTCVWSVSTPPMSLADAEDLQNELIELIGGGFSEANSYASTLIDKAAA